MAPGALNFAKSCPGTSWLLDMLWYISMDIYVSLISTTQSLRRIRGEVAEAIEVKGLVKDYGSVRAVDGINIVVHPGEVFAFLGPNGAGKTTTVEILEGLRPRTSGEVKVLGMDPWTQNASLIRRLGVIPQDFNFFEKISPSEAVTFYAGLFGKKVDAMALLCKVKLEDKAKALFDTLSGGQKQKLGLALALVHAPEVLFLDEPTTGLDPQARRSIWEVIRSLKLEGRTVFLTTHYLEEAEILADRVAIIDHGKIVAQGTPADIIREHGSPERLTLEAPPEMAEYLRRKLGLTVNMEDHNVEIEIHGTQDVMRILNAANESGIGWQGVTTKHETLEDVFIRLVGTPIDDETASGTASGKVKP